MKKIILLLFLWLGSCAATSARIQDLAKRQAASKDAIIVFSSKDFEQYAAAKDRDYHLMFFLNANYLASNAQMNLPKLRKEFALAAQAFKRGPNAKEVFFVELVYEHSKEVFNRLGIKQLPNVFHWGPEAVVKEGRSIKLAKSNECGPRIKTYPWPAEELVSCTASATGFTAGEVDRPSALKHPLFPLALLTFIIVGGYIAWIVYNSPIVRITTLWALGALAVYWFATSGGMYNIIRGIPLYYRGPQGKLVWWMEGRGGQLGAEGFIMGSSYIFFSTTLASLTYVVPRIRSNAARGVVSLVLVLLAAFTAMRILSTYQKKTGLGMRTFFSFKLF